MRTEWHEETWLEVKKVLEEHFADVGFKVQVNDGVRTVTISHGMKALSITDTTSTYYDYQNRMVFPDWNATA